MENPETLATVGYMVCLIKFDRLTFRYSNETKMINLTKKKKKKSSDITNLDLKPSSKEG